MEAIRRGFLMSKLRDTCNRPNYRQKQLYRCQGGCHWGNEKTHQEVKTEKESGWLAVLRKTLGMEVLIPNSKSGDSFPSAQCVHSPVPNTGTEGQGNLRWHLKYISLLKSDFFGDCPPTCPHTYHLSPEYRGTEGFCLRRSQ